MPLQADLQQVHFSITNTIPHAGGNAVIVGIGIADVVKFRENKRLTTAVRIQKRINN